MTNSCHSETLPQIVQRKKACPGCGHTFSVDWYDFDYSDNDALRRSVESLYAMVHCQACVFKFETEARERRGRGRSLRARAASYGRGWVPEDARGCTFDASERQCEARSTQIEDAFTWGRNWTPKSNDRWAFIMGPPGTGKSFFARCLLNRALKLGRTAYETDAEQVQKWALGWVDGDKRIADIMEADIVLVEEVGLCEWSEGGVKGLRRIVDNAYRSGKTILFTSNLTPEELFPRWQHACKTNLSIYTSIKDRMRAFTRFTFDGASLRKETKGQMAI